MFLQILEKRTKLSYGQFQQPVPLITFHISVCAYCFCVGIVATTTVEPVYNGHPWDHAKWLLYRGGLLIEVGGALGLY